MLDLLPILADFRCEIGSTIKRPSVGSEEDCHVPSTLTGKGLHCLHINAINVWSLLAVYFDRHKILVHDGRNLLVLKGFALHDMAPVTGRVANAEQDWLVFLLSLLQSFFTPWVPIYGVVCML